MENTKRKIQRMEKLYQETFSLAINHYGENSFYFCGKKMYVQLYNKLVISVEFQGTDVAYNQLVLMAIDKYGILDQNITSLKMIMSQTKSSEIGLEKNVTFHMALNSTGEYSATWNVQPEERDLQQINDFLMTYIDLFSGIVN